MFYLKNIPKNLQDKLIIEYRDIKKRYNLKDWGIGQLKSGRFAEVIIRTFQFLLGETVSSFNTYISSSNKEKIINKIKNSSNIDEHLRQKVTILTRLLIDFRNNRDSAHLGGFNANHMDAYLTMAVANWIVAELIRIYGGYSMEESEKIVSEITVKEFPVIIEKEGEQFISRNDLTSEQEILVLLYKNDRLDYQFLFSKTKDSNTSRFNMKIKKMIKNKLIAEKGQKYFIMPEGIKVVDEKSLLIHP